jgi:predicted ATPase/class 3 adenylate cyclase
LFSDIEGSTRLVKSLRDSYPQVLAEQRRLIRAAVSGQGGHEVDAQGNAFFAAFAGAKQAALCALEIQRALACHQWPAGARVRVRIGIHTGHAVPETGAYTGLAVHRAARICAAARGGQVLVSQATQTIIEDEEEEPGFTLVDLGERTLKDLDRPVRLFQLVAPGLDAPASPAAGQSARRSAPEVLASPDMAPEGPAATTWMSQRRTPDDMTVTTTLLAAGGSAEISAVPGANAVPGAPVVAGANAVPGATVTPAAALPHPGGPGQVPAGMVPVPATPLVGRQREAAALADLVVREGARLVTLTGPGGVGKTRLAMEAAERLGPHFADGARFVELAAVPAADLVAAAVAAGLGLTTSAGQLLADLQGYLRARRLLLVLDNFEHVVAAAPVLADLLAAAPGLVVLVTSRVVLRLRGEHELPVPPLPVPPAGADPNPAGLRGYASVGLFAERARAVAPGFELDGGNAATVAEICRRLDGLPLAIELAAARVRLLPPQALLPRLGTRLTLLTGGARDLPERQRTLRNTLDWSFGLLSAGEQAMLARLGVFAGSFGLPAAEAVCSEASQASQASEAGQGGPVIDTLGALVSSSLVRPETRGGEPRFGLLETVREYALEHLARGGWAEAHDRHAAYFLALAEPAEAELRGQGQLAWLDRLETEHDNLWAAMSWLVGHGALEQATHLLSVTWRFWWLHGHAAEFARLGEQIVASGERLPPYQRALALFGTGFLLFANGDQAGAQLLFEQSLLLYRQMPGKLTAIWTAAVLGILGRVAALDGNYSRAGELLGQGQALFGELVDDDFTGYARVQYLLFTGMVDNFLGQVRLGQGDHEGATRLFTSGLATARRAQDRILALASLYDLALASHAQGDLAGAAGYLKEGLTVASEAGDETSAAYYLEGLAAVAGQQDDPQRAARLLTAARSLLEARGSGWLRAFVPPAWHDEALLTALRSRLGAEAFAEAQVWGGSAGSRRATQYALE